MQCYILRTILSMLVSWVFLTSSVHGEPIRYDVERQRAIQCIALAIYHETKFGELDDQLAVAGVVIARANTGGRWPNDVCDVIAQEGQWTWWETSRPRDLYPRNQGAWRRALYAAAQVVDRPSSDPFGGRATCFHASYVQPEWSHQYPLLGRLGSHLYYNCRARSRSK
jgi:spore germination cell wall hydrolase CwlJ-like protein